MATVAPPDKGGLLTNVAARNARTHRTYQCGRSILPPLHTAGKNIYLTLQVRCMAVDGGPPTRPLSFLPREVPKVLCLPLRQRVLIHNKIIRPTRGRGRLEGDGTVNQRKSTL